MKKKLILFLKKFLLIFISKETIIYVNNYVKDEKRMDRFKDKDNFFSII